MQSIYNRTESVGLGNIGAIRQEYVEQYKWLHVK